MKFLYYVLQLRQFQEAKRAKEAGSPVVIVNDSPPLPDKGCQDEEEDVKEDEVGEEEKPAAASFFLGSERADSASPLSSYFKSGPGLVPTTSAFTATDVAFAFPAMEKDESSVSLQVNVPNDLPDNHWSNISLMSKSEIPLGPPTSAFDSFASPSSYGHAPLGTNESVARLSEEIRGVLTAPSVEVAAAEEKEEEDDGEEALLRRTRLAEVERRNAELEEQVRAQKTMLQQFEVQNSTLVSRMVERKEIDVGIVLGRHFFFRAHSCRQCSTRWQRRSWTRRASSTPKPTS